MEKKNKKTIVMYLAPAMVMIIVFLYVPIIINFINSLFNWGALSPKRSFVGVTNYTKMFNDGVFWTAIRNNFIFVVLSLICQIGVSLIIAALLEEQFMRRLQNIFRTIYFIPSLMMATVVGIVFKMIYSPTLGLVNPFLEAVGIDTSKIDLLGNSSSAIYAITVMSQWQYIGYMVILFVVAIQNIPEDLYEAAAIDGAGTVKRFLKITLPQLKDTIIVNAIIILTGAIRVFDEVFVTTKGGPGTSTETLATYLYRVGFKNDQMGYASAVAFVIFIITFILGLFQMKSYQLEEE
ncbi:MAG TPA: sugar ABC transporter permease [Clostridiales bacterium]|nr:sugar ABC transporter permease [Clostridiales bacterium]